ncbi:MAG: response regulator [Desulfatirhabdiaceae bacterium]
MNREELRRQLLATFQAQLEEHLHNISNGLLAIETETAADNRMEIVKELFRAAHSIKGAARAVEIRDIESIAHKIEDVFYALKMNRISPSPELVDLALKARDLIEEAMSLNLQGSQLSRNQLSGFESDLLSLLKAVNTGDFECSEAPEWEKSQINSLIPGRMDHVREPEEKNPENRSAKPGLQENKATEIAEPVKHPVRDLQEESIRVATQKVDSLMAGMGELLVARMRMEQRLTEIKEIQFIFDAWEKKCQKIRNQRRYGNRQSLKKNGLLSEMDILGEYDGIKGVSQKIHTTCRRMEADYRQMVLLTDDIQESVRSVRMVPMSTLFDIFPRMIRDIGREKKKEIILGISGGETEIDRRVLETLKDPLMHLLRNAVDHGIETPEQRARTGKPGQGSIRLNAYQKGNHIVTEIMDDGAGIDTATLKKVAIQKKILDPKDAEKLGWHDTINLIFQSGFSTLENVTDLSGRGVGMDVVRERLEKMNGQVDVTTEPGKGTTFSLILPLTLATSHVLLFEVSAQTLAVPTTAVERILHIDPADIGMMEGKTAIRYNGNALPLMPMSQVLQLRGKNSDAAGEKIQAVILRSVEERIAFQVDGFTGTQDLVVKSLGRQLQRLKNIAGATILGTGQVVMVLNVAGLLKSARMKTPVTVFKKPAVEISTARNILVVDDSITTRTLEKNILENYGYRVQTAADGLEGWELIQIHPFDVFVFDVDMPRMNGLQLAERVRSESRFAPIPIILVTSLESPQDKIRGMEAGADAYITKGSFDQHELLQTIERLIG